MNYNALCYSNRYEGNNENLILCLFNMDKIEGYSYNLTRKRILDSFY